MLCLITNLSILSPSMLLQCSALALYYKEIYKLQYIFWININTYHPNYRIWVICLSIKIKTKLNKPQIPSIVEIKGHRRLERRGGGCTWRREPCSFTCFADLKAPIGQNWGGYGYPLDKSQLTGKKSSKFLSLVHCPIVV